MKKETTKEKPALPAITTLAELRAAIEKPLTCAFMLDDREVRLTVNRITAPVDEARRALVRAVTPPYVAQRNGVPFNDYDRMSPEYLKARELAEDTARSLMAYHCCAEVRAGNPGMADPAAIHNYVKALLPPTILEMIALTALGSGLSAEVSARANFT